MLIVGIVFIAIGSWLSGFNAGSYYMNEAWLRWLQSKQAPRTRVEDLYPKRGDDEPR